MNEREAKQLNHGDRVMYLGRINDKYPDVEPHIGCGGRIVSSPGHRTIDTDGDLRIVWDDHAYNDQAYAPGDDRSWLYCHYECVDHEVQINIHNINEIERYLEGHNG